MGIRVDKNLSWVKSMTIPRFAGAIYSIPITHTWQDVSYKYMPNVETTISVRVEIDYTDRIGIIWIVENE
jgi:hypothetical protein